MKSKTQQQNTVSKINDFLNENMGLPVSNSQSTLKTQVLFSLPVGSFVHEALDFRLNDPEVTEITLWKVGSGRRSK